MVCVSGVSGVPSLLVSILSPKKVPQDYGYVVLDSLNIAFREENDILELKPNIWKVNMSEYLLLRFESFINIYEN